MMLEEKAELFNRTFVICTAYQMCCAVLQLMLTLCCKLHFDLLLHPLFYEFVQTAVFNKLQQTCLFMKNYP